MWFRGIILNFSKLIREGCQTRLEMTRKNWQVLGRYFWRWLKELEHRFLKPRFATWESICASEFVTVPQLMNGMLHIFPQNYFKNLCRQWVGATLAFNRSVGKELLHEFRLRNRTEQVCASIELDCDRSTFSISLFAWIWFWNRCARVKTGLFQLMHIHWYQIRLHDEIKQKKINFLVLFSRRSNEAVIILIYLLTHLRTKQNSFGLFERFSFSFWFMQNV